MEHVQDWQEMYQAALAIRKQVKAALPEDGRLPAWVIQLGSGFGAAVEDFPILMTIPYGRIDLMGESGVSGHSGKLTLRDIGNGNSVVVLEGRRHYYEGIPDKVRAFPAMVAKVFQAKMLLTVGAGSLRTNVNPDSLVVVDDHVSFLPSPLVGPVDSEFVVRFPDQSEVYTPELRAQMVAVLTELGVPHQEGIYIANTGPQYETPAQIRFLQQSTDGAVVGMSLTGVSIVASAMGLDLVALAGVTNLAAGIHEGKLDHDKDVVGKDEVLEDRSALWGSALKAFLLKVHEE